MFDHVTIRASDREASERFAGTTTEHVHMAFGASDNATVDEFHRAASEAGYRDHGAPGERPVYHPGYYGAYVLDPDGRNVEVVTHNRSRSWTTRRAEVHAQAALTAARAEPRCSSRCIRGTAMRVAATAGALLSAAVTAAVAPASENLDRRGAKLHGNNFFSNCRFSHTGYDDPIVHPGHPGRSHAHTFFGNTSTNARSTLATLRAASTTCKPRADRAAYWIPTLFKDGREVRPAKGQFYYVLRGYETMRPFPAGLRMIAGNALARRSQSRLVAYWACGGSGGVRLAPSRTVPTCRVVDARFDARVRACPTCPLVRKTFQSRVKTFVQLHVNFPDCWDGRRLDSPDHRSHMAYSRGYRCPASHPVKVPLIRLMIRYPITNGEGAVLASGGQFSGHADFFNAWDQRALARLVDDCFHDRPCNPS